MSIKPVIYIHIIECHNVGVEGCARFKFSPPKSSERTPVDVKLLSCYFNNLRSGYRLFMPLEILKVAEGRGPGRQFSKWYLWPSVQESCVPGTKSNPGRIGRLGTTGDAQFRWQVSVRLSPSECTCAGRGLRGKVISASKMQQYARPS